MRRRNLASLGLSAMLAACVEEQRPATGGTEGARPDPNAPLPAGYSGRLVPLPLGPDGAPLQLMIGIRRPSGPGPHPLLIMHHGSTGTYNPVRGRVMFFPEEVASPFLRGGYMVAMPQRRGRGGSEGEYLEGVVNGGYTAARGPALAGYERAMADAEAATAWLLARPEVDASRVVLAGHSRGGILALGQAVRQPIPGLRGVINFVGGWVTERGDARDRVNRALFEAAGRGARAPALFLYGQPDPFYSLEHSRANFELWQSAGGRGTFESFGTPPNFGPTGHQLHTFPAIWRPAATRFLGEAGLPPLGLG